MKRSRMANQGALPLWALLLIPVTASAADNSSPADDSAILPLWHGVWRGQLENTPVPLDPSPMVEFVVDVGEDAADGCLTWRSTYSFEGVVDAMKDYRLCADTAHNYRLDEGGGVYLHMSVYGDEMYSAFELSGEKIALFTHTRLIGDQIVHDIYSTKGADEPVPGLETFIGARRQRVIFTRAQNP